VSFQNPPQTTGVPSDQDELFSFISNSITDLTQSLHRIQQLVNTIGGPRDSREIRLQVNHMMTQANQLSKEVAKSMKSLDAYDGQSKEMKNRKLLKSKLVKDFQGVAAQLKMVVEQAAKKEKDFPLKESANNSGTFGNTRSQVDMEETPDPRRQEEQIKFQQLEEATDFNVKLIQERDQNIREVEKAVIEVNEIFVDLASLVQEQGTMIDNIESNIVEAHHQVESGTQELHKASNYQKSARGKMCILAGIIVTVVGIAVLVVYFLSTSIKL